MTSENPYDEHKGSMCVTLKHAHSYGRHWQCNVTVFTLASCAHFFKGLHLVFDFCFKLVLQHKAEEEGGREEEEGRREEGREEEGGREKRRDGVRREERQRREGGRKGGDTEKGRRE